MCLTSLFFSSHTCVGQDSLLVQPIRPHIVFFRVLIQCIISWKIFMSPKTVVPGGTKVPKTSQTPYTPFVYDKLYVSSHRVFLMKSSDDSFINGANPGGFGNEMEITAHLVHAACDRQQPGSSKNASVCAVQELEITKIHPSSVRFNDLRAYSCYLPMRIEETRSGLREELKCTRTRVSRYSTPYLLSRNMRRLYPRRHEAELRFAPPAELHNVTLV